MPKKNPEREAKRQRHKELTEFLDSVGVSDVAGVQELFKGLVGSVLQNGLEGELEEELGYSSRLFRGQGCAVADPAGRVKGRDKRSPRRPPLTRPADPAIL